jgi:hypothetical protein
LSTVVALKAQPDWPAAAQILIDGCAHAAHAQARVDVLERLCMALGDALYPAFLNVLSLIGERGSAAAQSAVAEGLVDALRSGRLPAGKRAAWGGALPVPQPGARSPMVTLGPIEYLCAVQLPADAAPASRTATSLGALLRLVNHNDTARRLYIARLHALSQEPPDGGLSRDTRQVLDALADAWGRSAHAPQQAVEAALAALPRRDRLAQFGQAAWR